MVGTARRMTAGVTGVQGSDFKGRERLAAVTAGAGNTIRQYAYNPGLKNTFSLGHQIARSFEKYVMHSSGNFLEYKTSSPSTRSGRVYMYANYDPSDQLPTSEDEFADRSDVVVKCLWEDFRLTLRGSEMTPGGPKPIRVGETAQDLNITDACTIVIGTFGSDVEGSCGNLFINYNGRLLVQRPLTLAQLQPKRSAIFTVPDIPNIPNNTTLGIPLRVADGLGTTRAQAAGSENHDGILLLPGAYIVSVQLALDFAAHSGQSFGQIVLTLNDVVQSTTAGAQEVARASGTTHSMLLHTNHNYIVVPDEGLVLNVRVDHFDVGSDSPSVNGARTRILIQAA